MKKCNLKEKYLQNYLDSNILEKDKIFYESHIKFCSECQNEKIFYQKLLNSIKKIKLEKVSDDFKLRLHKNIVEFELLKNEELKKNTFFKIWKYSIVTLAVILSFGVIYIYISNRNTANKENRFVRYFEDNYSGFQLDNYLRQKHISLDSDDNYIRINIISKKSIENVYLEITLPEEIYVRHPESKFKWQGDLKGGENHLIFKVRGLKEGEYPIEVKFKKNGLEKKLIKNVEVLRM